MSRNVNSSVCSRYRAKYGPDRVAEAQLPPGVLRIRKQVVFDRGTGEQPEGDVVERRGIDARAAAHRPVIVHAARDEAVEVALVARRAQWFLLVEIEVFARMLDFETHRDLPVVGNPIRAQVGAQVELTGAFLAGHRDRTLHAHHPEVPRIGRRSRLARLRCLLDLDGQSALDAITRKVVQHADGDGCRQPLPLRVFGVAALRDRAQVEVHALETAEAYQRDGLFEAAARRVGTRDDDVHVGFGGIAHVLHHVDFFADVVAEAVVAVEVHLQAPIHVLRRRARRQDTHKDQSNDQSTFHPTHLQRGTLVEDVYSGSEMKGL